MDHLNMKRSSGTSIGGGNTKRFIIAAVVVVIVLAIVAFGANMLLTKSPAGSIKKSQYQSVFLTNGQVYFGKIASLDDENLVMTDIYYLQVQQGSTPDTKTQASQVQSNDQNLSLAKLGSELHGPEDKMFISQKQVLFWENLKDDSQVVKAIGQNKSK